MAEKYVGDIFLDDSLFCGFEIEAASQNCTPSAVLSAQRAGPLQRCCVQGTMGKRPPRFRCSVCDELIALVGNKTIRNHKRQCRGPAEMCPEEDTRPEAEGFEDVRSILPAGLDNFEHLTQFLNTGRCVCTEEELQLVRFVHMAHGGYGTSREFSEGMLAYTKESGGKNVHLPDTWKVCVERAHDLIRRLEGGRKTFEIDVPIPQNVRDLLADPSQETISFEFECPITALIRVAMFSKTCKSWDNVALSYEENEGYLSDFCNGDRYQRIASTLSPGGAILGAVLATDGICMDKCMFDSQEVRAHGKRDGIGLRKGLKLDWDWIEAGLGIGFKLD